jgi:hypothetical protein
LTCVKKVDYFDMCNFHYSTTTTTTTTTTTITTTSTK